MIETEKFDEKMYESWDSDETDRPYESVDTIDTTEE
jgi:hypothetical protein